MAADGPLNVVALVSGGKDSFYSILHCLVNGHRVIALANLYPPTRAVSAAQTSKDTATNIRAEVGDNLRSEIDSASTTTFGISSDNNVTPQQQRGPSSETSKHDNGDEEDEADLNSFMYQTVGHQVVPLYAQATGLPLFRQPILGTAVDYGISYKDPDGQHEHEDETESLIPLLRSVLKAHPEVNAICTGAILSTYQRTRVESVALRLGLIPLAFLWQFPKLPLNPFSDPAATATSLQNRGPGNNDDDAQLLRDMATMGLEARIVKVASAGLGEEFLWENVASEATVARIRRALRRFGGDGGRGAVLGEGGEFETLVVDGPPALFKGRIVVRDGDKKVVREGGGSAWLSIPEAKVEMKPDANASSQKIDDLGVRIPNLLNSRFSVVLESLRGDIELNVNSMSLSDELSLGLSPLKLVNSNPSGENWVFVGYGGSVENQTARIVDEISKRLHEFSLSPTAITSSVIALRRMADFPTINKLYGALFREPNPPARVTISCGEIMLPQSADITILLTVQPQMRPQDRRGLHVQSRSYWAPANIGPYSQAIAYPLLSEDEGQGGDDQKQQQSANSDSSLAVSIAGQIPLIPASMILPPVPSNNQESNLPLQNALALQHLWRVGVEMKVQWWSSAVAYFPRSSSPSEARHRALLAATAWETAHTTSRPGPSADTDEGPDLWDRKYNPMYMTYDDSGEAAARPSLPDWEVLKDFDEDDVIARRPVPFVFSVEVEELPRSAGVEWHAHLGFANVNPGSIRMHTVASLSADLILYHTIVEASTSDVFVQTVVTYQRVEGTSFDGVANRFALAVKGSLTGLLANTKLSESAQTNEDYLIAAIAVKPKLTYINPESFDLLNDPSSLSDKGGIIPCRSLWDSLGCTLDVVSIFETKWTKAKL
ncbi:adenine nucleotide alpha hydrolases-like protein [Hypoxylon trugodes]|uniref:adenine nucleotide alpha hydrolases-like protein n=1 Tax=Hypoxylon trugodes TaxID=326681 RepID=UPI00218C9097|nr:adenine nucleotide alpha hydrolases-like protein [Hypoxylon trugodes]KAI1390219.1 adenine nucleotide alpha hydrolases-like protein [Hypoxylon trugodes]